MKKKIEKHLKKIKEVSPEVHKFRDSKLKHRLFDHPVIKFIIFILINLTLTQLSGYYPENNIISITSIIINITIAVYFVMGIIYIVRRELNRLLNPKNTLSLVGAYAFLVIMVILIFATIFSIVNLGKFGALQYGSCSDSYDPHFQIPDSIVSHDYFYFSAVTFFTVGYGDICPMGIMKYAAILNALVGHLISVIVVALILNNYMRLKENKPEEVKKK